MFGGDHAFINVNGVWGKYLLPEGKRFENGDKIRIDEMTLLGEYDEVGHPPKDEGSSDFEEKFQKWEDNMKRKDKEMAFDPTAGSFGAFVMLVPKESK